MVADGFLGGGHGEYSGKTSSRKWTQRYIDYRCRSNGNQFKLTEHDRNFNHKKKTIFEIDEFQT